MTNSEKERALSTIKELIQEHQLTKEELTHTLHEAGVTLGYRAAFLNSIQYIGGILIFSAIAVLIGMYWEELSDISRVIVTLGAGLVCYTLGWLYSPSRTATLLFLMAAPLEPTGMLIALDSFVDPPKYYESLFTSCVFVVMTLQFFTAYRTFQLPVLLNGVLIFSSFAYFAVCHWVDIELAWHIDNEIYFSLYGAGMFLLSYRLRETFHTRIATELWLSISALFLMFNLFDWLEHSLFEPIYPLVVIGCLLVSNRVHSLLLSIVSIGALLFYVGHLTSTFFPNALAWPIGLLILGVSCLWIRSRWSE